MATDREAKGKQLMLEAEQKLNVTTTGRCCSSSTSRAKVEEACELYVKAANSFKMCKKWTLAGNAFSEAAALKLSNKRLHEAGLNYVEASKCYKKENTDESMKCLLKAAEIYTEMGRSRVAAKHHESLAELYEKDEWNVPTAIDHYIIASDMYGRDSSTKAANRCLLNAAKFSALRDDFGRAIEIYETVARSSLDSSLLKYVANDLFLRASLCQMCVSPRKALARLDSYAELSPAFSSSRECTLVLNMAQKAIAKDLDGFNEAIRDYESITVLDPWYRDITKKIRKQIQGVPDLR